MHEPRTLLVVGSNPPSQSSGARTLARAELARDILEFDEVLLVNLFTVPTYRTGDIKSVGGEVEGWLLARPALDAGLSEASGVLLAYGLQAPTGPARRNFELQVDWLRGRLGDMSLPGWWVGGAPRHPSRWQRFTFREFPGFEFREALRLALQPVEYTLTNSPDAKVSPVAGTGSAAPSSLRCGLAADPAPG